MDNNSKALTFGGAVYDAPLADISAFSEEEKKMLWRKAMSLAVFDYDAFSSDEELENAIACYVDVEFRDKATPENKECLLGKVQLWRGFYYHHKKYIVWKEKELDPLVERLADYALKSPQYDKSYLMGLELRKLECMDAYFSHSVSADADGCYPSSHWIRLCIKLLGFLVDECHIPEKSILDLNVRNVRYPVSKWEIEQFQTASDNEDRILYGRKIYWHKANSLYCHIREHSIHTWWN